MDYLQAESREKDMYPCLLVIKQSSGLQACTVASGQQLTAICETGLCLSNNVRMLILITLISQFIFKSPQSGNGSIIYKVINVTRGDDFNNILSLLTYC